MRSILITTVALLVGGCVGANVPVVPEVMPQVITDRDSVNPIAIERLVSQVPRGQQVGVIGGGLLCIPHGALTANGRVDDSFLETVHHEFQVIRYPVTNSPSELFTTAANEATRLRLAGRIVDARANVCFPMMGFGNVSTGSGDASVTVEWQVYDSVMKSIVATVTTTGSGQVSSITDPKTVVADIAIGMATRRLILNPQFQAITQRQPVVESRANTVPAKLHTR